MCSRLPGVLRARDCCPMEGHRHLVAARECNWRFRWQCTGKRRLRHCGRSVPDCMRRFRIVFGRKLEPMSMCNTCGRCMTLEALHIPSPTPRRSHYSPVSDICAGFRRYQEIQLSSKSSRHHFVLSMLSFASLQNGKIRQSLLPDTKPS